MKGPREKSIRFLVSMCVATDPRISIFSFLSFCYNDVQLQPKLLDRLVFCRAVFYTTFFQIGVRTFARFVRPLLATILCVWEIWCGSNNRVYMYYVFHWLAKIKIPPPQIKRVTAPILKPTYDQKTETHSL